MSAAFLRHQRRPKTALSEKKGLYTIEYTNLYIELYDFKDK